MRGKLNLFTHNGIFHADDVFAAALLGLMAEEISVTRGGDTEVPESGDWIVFDIGGGELDHHSVENKERNGTHPGTDIPYAACGLVWKKYYREILEAMDCEPRYMESVYSRLETSLILESTPKTTALTRWRQRPRKCPILRMSRKNRLSLRQKPTSLFPS